MMESKSLPSERIANRRGSILGRAAARTSLLVLMFVVATAAAQAQVPQDVTFRGRLVDAAGTPQTGPVTLELRVFDAETLGNELYAESHSGVALDVSGAFAVQLGLGSPLSGTFDAALFSDVTRWLEVVVTGQTLAPRQIIGSVPWALVAQQANELVPDPNAPRFEDCGDGTVADHQTGLQWEKKTGTVGLAVVCAFSSCLDPHDVNNYYAWSNTGTMPDGDVFTDFLARLNGDPALVEATLTEARGDPAADPTVCFARHCDWRLPAIGEQRTILVGLHAAPGQATTCSSNPCIDPDFATIGGPTYSAGYKSSSSSVEFPNSSLISNFFSQGIVTVGTKTGASPARAVRHGSCR